MLITLQSQMRPPSATTLTIVMITIIIKISAHKVTNLGSMWTHSLKKKKSWIDVDTCETLSQPLALQWAQDLHLTNVDFKLDSKNVMTEFQVKLYGKC